MKAIKPIAAGEEIFNDYGEIPRADLLRRYGYVTDNYAQYDVVELSLSNICQAAGLRNDDIESQPPVYHPLFPPFHHLTAQAMLTHSQSWNFSKSWNFLMTDTQFQGSHQKTPCRTFFPTSYCSCSKHWPYHRNS